MPSAAPAHAVRGARWWPLARALACIAGLAFMGWLGWRLLDAPQSPLWSASIAGIGAAVAVGVVANAAVGMAFADLIGKLSPQVPYRRRIAAYYYSQIAKYTPGRVAALLVQRSMLRGEGATATTIVSNLELAAISAGLGCASACVLAAGMRSMPAATALAAAAIAVAAWLLRADWRSLLVRLRAWPSAAPASENRPGLARAVVLAVAMLALPAASGFAMLALGLHVNTGDAVMLTALLQLSWVAAMLAFVFPVGIGVRELVFVSLGGLVPGFADGEFMAGVAIASRLVQLLIDAVGVAAFLVARRWLAEE